MGADLGRLESGEPTRRRAVLMVFALAAAVAAAAAAEAGPDLASAPPATAALLPGVRGLHTPLPLALALEAAAAAAAAEALVPFFGALVGLLTVVGLMGWTIVLVGAALVATLFLLVAVFFFLELVELSSLPPLAGDEEGRERFLVPLLGPPALPAPAAADVELLAPSLPFLAPLLVDEAEAEAAAAPAAALDVASSGAVLLGSSIRSVPKSLKEVEGRKAPKPSPSRSRAAASMATCAPGWMPPASEFEGTDVGLAVVVDAAVFGW
mmetsp:Transcript_38428/g.78429  ORF Transcript_38428/g.78429 Transcript_38428/m.78429 type:complete len:267 (+) Transcript_38428:1996-2796(+)